MIRIFNTKTYLLTFFLAFFTLQKANGFWEKIDIDYTGFQDVYWLEVFFLPDNPDYGWLCGYNSAVLITTDGGQTWEGSHVEENMIMQLESIIFVNEKTGYTSGSGRIFKSTDGGHNWRDVTPRYFSPSIWGNFFIDEMNGVCVGGGCIQQDPQQFYITSDGGLNWDVTYKNKLGTGLTDVVIYEKGGLGYAVSSGKIWITEDGGKDWFIFSESGNEDWQEELAHSGNSFLFPFSTECSGNGDSGGMRMSTNFGSTWREYTTGASMFGSFLHDEMRGWTCGFSGNIHYTSDGGQTWELRNCGAEGYNLDDIWFLNDTVGYVVGESAIFKYINVSDTAKPEIFVDGPDVLCPGEYTSIRAADGFVSYKWSTGETGQTIVVDKPGKYWVRAEINPCIRGNSDTVEIMLAPEPEITITTLPEGTVCEGDTIQMTANSEYDIYRWDDGTTGKVSTATESGTYTVYVTDIYGCEWSKSIELDFMPNPEPSLEYIGRYRFCQGDTAILRTDQEYNTYEWYREKGGSMQELDEKTRSIAVTESGLYNVVVTNQWGCEGVSEQVEVEVRLDTNKLEFVWASQRKEHEIDSTVYRDLTCNDIIIRNKGWKPAVIDELVLFNNIAFSFPQSQFPVTIAPFDSARIEICYSPTDIGTQRDTVLLPDICSDHLLPIISTGLELIYNIDTKCDVGIRLSARPYENYVYVPLGNYPNPASVNFVVDFFEFLPEDEESLVSARLYDYLGNKLISALPDFSKSVKKEKGTERFGFFNIDISGLRSGSYQLVINAGRKAYHYSVVVNR